MRPDPCFERFRSLLPPCNYQVAGTWHHDQNKIKWRSDFEIGLLFVGDVLLSTRRNHPASNQVPSSACHPGAFACTIRKHSWLFLKIYWGFAKVVSACCFFKWNHAGRKELTFVIKTFGGPGLPVLRLENNFRAIWYLVYNLQGLKRHHSISRNALLEAEENGLLPGRYTKPRSLYGMEVLKFSLKLTLSSSALAIYDHS